MPSSFTPLRPASAQAVPRLLRTRIHRARAVLERLLHDREVKPNAWSEEHPSADLPRKA